MHENKYDGAWIYDMKTASGVMEYANWNKYNKKI